MLLQEVRIITKANFFFFVNFLLGIFLNDNLSVNIHTCIYVGNIYMYTVEHIMTIFNSPDLLVRAIIKSNFGRNSSMFFFQLLQRQEPA